MAKIDLLQPRHNCAPSPEKKPHGHIYMPTSLMIAGARLQHAGVDVNFHDANIRPFEPSNNIIGINLLGAPYIPEVMELQKNIRTKFAAQFQFVLGGQVISGLTHDQFLKLFGEDSINGNDNRGLANLFSLHPSTLPPVESTSLIPMYELLSDEDMREYLSREFSFFVSQGCKFSCNFCAAVRTSRDPLTRELKKVKESYRNMSVLKEDLAYLMNKAERLELNHLQIYMSNLDVFQTPPKLLEFAQIVKDVQKRYPNIKISLRGLATAQSFLMAKKKYPECIRDIVDVGFHTVGFGVDGMTPRVWNKIKKGHNTKKKCIKAIRSVREDFNITPELLMVFGHAGIDTPRTLELAYQFTQDMVSLYGAVPRPHVAKSFIPGNKGWHLKKNAHAISELIAHPEAFQLLDFTALPSRLTHPDKKMRDLATYYFLKICSVAGNTTQWMKPILPEFTSEEIKEVKSFNEGRYDR